MEELVALPPGIRVGRWTITKKLGAGAFGAVYLCVNDEGVQAALKTEPVNTPHPLLVMEHPCSRDDQTGHPSIRRREALLPLLGPRAR
ncbi:hypothetical protein niasHS_009621 [Heterodera schachtii]|uniref:Protein kinase domain-containing protein n=1 Tax=Heterodera schachtii TaxID=97005 RepID=A0ABD2JEE6_HETSC